MQLVGKRAVIVGGASNIGNSTARAYVEEGASIAILDIADEQGEALARELNAKQPGKAAYYHCDVAKSQEVKDVFGEAIARLGGVDVLAVPGGGMGSYAFATPQEISEERLDRMLAVNVKGTIYCNQAVYQPMKEGGGGAIINFASGAGLVPVGMADYGAAKGAVISWTRHVAFAWGPDNIRVNTMCPAAEGGALNPVGFRVTMSEEDKARFKVLKAEAAKKVPLRRGGRTVED